MNGSPEPATDSDPIWKWLGGKWALVALCLVLLVVALYAEEDWRGAAEWNQAQAEIAAAGESLDPKKFIPPPVPDDQNFAALPIFEVDIDPSWGVDPVGMHRAFARINVNNIPAYPETKHDPDQLPFVGDWLKADEPDLPAIQKEMAELCDRRGIKPPARTLPLDMFELLCPALGQLRAADKTRPYSRFNVIYNAKPANDMSWASVAGSRELAKVLLYEEQLALSEHRPDLAFTDLKMGWKINFGLRNEALLYAGVFATHGQAIQLGVIAQGLGQHAWKRDQLVELDGDLGAIDDLAMARLCVRGNVAIEVVPSTDYLKKHRSEIPDQLFGRPTPTHFGLSPVGEFIATTIAMLLPDGWMDDWKSQNVRLNLLGAVKVVDPEKHRAYPEKQAKAASLVTGSKSTHFWNVILLRNMSFGLDEMEPFAYAQVEIDEARIACRLERFHLDHGSYPASLADLAPAYGTELPHDVMNGEPYHYKVLPDGTYLLYSVGWDQVDDGGKEAASQYHYYAIDADWVWHNHPHAKKSK